MEHAHRKDLFVNLQFHMRPGKNRHQIRVLVEHGGGKMVPSTDVNPRVIRLTEKTSDRQGVHIDFILDSVKANKLQDDTVYSLPGYNGRKAGVTSTTIQLERNQFKSGRSRFQPEEDACIMDYITRTYHASNRTGGLGGNLLWKEMELQKITNHPWQAMKDRYEKYLKPKMHLNNYMPLTMVEAGNGNKIPVYQPPKIIQKAPDSYKLANRSEALNAESKEPLESSIISPSKLPGSYWKKPFSPQKIGKKIKLDVSMFPEREDPKRPQSHSNEKQRGNNENDAEPQVYDSSQEIDAICVKTMTNACSTYQNGDFSTADLPECRVSISPIHVSPDYMSEDDIQSDILATEVDHSDESKDAFMFSVMSNDVSNHIATNIKADATFGLMPGDDSFDKGLKRFAGINQQKTPPEENSLLKDHPIISPSFSILSQDSFYVLPSQQDNSTGSSMASIDPQWQEGIDLYNRVANCDWESPSTQRILETLRSEMKNDPWSIVNVSKLSKS